MFVNWGLSRRRGHELVVRQAHHTSVVRLSLTIPSEKRGRTDTERVVLVKGGSRSVQAF